MITIRPIPAARRRRRRAWVASTAIVLAVTAGACSSDETTDTTGTTAAVGGTSTTSTTAAPSGDGGGPDDVDLAVVQTQLTAVGCGTGGADGQLGPATASAISDFQAAEGLPVTGELDPDTALAIGQAATDGRTVCGANDGPDGGGSGNAGSGEELSAAQQQWAAASGQAYYMVLDISSEGLGGRYCVSGTAGDPGSVSDLAGTDILSASCLDAQPFIDAQSVVSVERLFEWSGEALGVGGTVAFGESGVPTSINAFFEGEVLSSNLDVAVIEFSFFDPSVND